MNKGSAHFCVAIWVVLLLSSCCSGGLRRKIEDVHLRSGGAVEVFKFGYPVIGVGYSDVYIASCHVLWRGEDGRIIRSGVWWSDYFCMTEDEFAALEPRLATISDKARRDREEGCLAGVRGDLVDEVLASDEFLVGYRAAVDIKNLGGLHVKYN